MSNDELQTYEQPQELQAYNTSTSALILDRDAMKSMMETAEYLSEGRVSIPKHLQGNRADCLAVVMQAVQWKMNPFAVAQQTYFINGAISYGAKLVSSAITSVGPLIDRPHYEWFGDWTKIIGKFEIRKGDKGEYRSPGWKLADEEGLGVKVWATIRGESEPRVLELLLAQARTRNSTLWADDPKQQLAYLAIKRWGNLYCPDVILGVFTPDEADEREVNPADDPPPRQAERVLEDYPEDQFKRNLPSWRKLILAGKANADFIRDKVSSLHTMSDAQMDQLYAADREYAEAEAAKAAEAPQEDAAQ